MTPIARQVRGATTFNTINLRTVEIFLQKSPGRPGDVRGITGMSFDVVDSTGALIQAGTTGADGRVRMRIQGGVSTLRLLASTPAAEYTVRLRDDPIEGQATVDGIQRRLRMLGYHIGHTGADANGVDGAATVSVEFDRSILEFQADANNIPILSVADAATQAALAAAARA